MWARNSANATLSSYIGAYVAVQVSVPATRKVPFLTLSSTMHFSSLHRPAPQAIIAVIGMVRP
jgi:hypothetical protein